tara:strand:+ start:477 stop:1331 length:855 start_codon:yes stop_codon:yes gene_type:complete
MNQMSLDFSKQQPSNVSYALNDNDIDNDISIALYQELLSHSGVIKEFLKNTDNFLNRLKFEKVNMECYKSMYSNINSGDVIPPLDSFYDKIDGLKELNDSAYKFFMKPRNNSIKELDVQLGDKFDEVLINFLNQKNIRASRADQKNKRLPDIKVLDKNKKIKAYIEHKYHNAPFMLSHKLIDRESYEGSITLDFKKIQNQIIVCESEIPDKPVYIVHWVDFHHLKGVFFNTLEQIKYYIQHNDTFTRKDRSGDYKLTKKIGYTEKFYPPLHEMGDFNELLIKLK